MSVFLVQISYNAIATTHSLLAFTRITEHNLRLLALCPRLLDTQYGLKSRIVCPAVYYIILINIIELEQVRSLSLCF